MKTRGIRLMDNQTAEIKDASGRVLLRVRIRPGPSGLDGPTVEIGMEPGNGRKTAGFDWSDRACRLLRAAADSVL